MLQAFANSSGAPLMFLGLDIGTSGVKALVLNESGCVIDQQSVGLTVSRPSPLWSEQTPGDWWSACDAAVQMLDAKVRSCVRAIGLAGQMHGATLLGQDDRPLRPAILWNDGRSFAECGELEERVPNFRRISSNVAMPGFTAPKLNWIRKHEPEIFDQVRTVLLPKDFVRLCMTGERASDMSDSAGTLWLDVSERRWSEELLRGSGLTIEQMPRLFEGTDVTGILRGEIADRWGMEKVPVVGGGGDNAAGALGAGVIQDGEALLSLGTSGVIFAVTADLRPNATRGLHAFCHCIPDTWHQMTVHLSAAACIDWVARLVRAHGPAEVMRAAETIGPGGGPELFLPYLSGERTPHNDPHVRGAFLGLDHDTSGASLAAAVLEGVAFALADGLAVMRDAGTSIERLSVIGGGARSHYWGRIIASALEVDLHYIDGGEVGPARGAAQLARIGVDGVDVAAVCNSPRTLEIVSPEPLLSHSLAKKLARFRTAYQGIKPKEKA